MANEAAAVFWKWAVRVYADRAVNNACLELQDQHGQCVPLLLWASWLGSRGTCIDEVAAERAAGMARAWSGTLLEPIRCIRRRMKEPVAQMPDGTRLAVRERIKALELDGERLLMAELATVACEATAVADPACGFDNAVRVAGKWLPQVPHVSLQRLVSALDAAP